MTVRIDRGEHTAVLGTTGAGKTYFILHSLIPAHPRAVVVDSKGGIDFPPEAWPLLHKDPKLATKQVAKALKDDEHPRWQFAWRPPERNMEDAVGEFCLGCLRSVRGVLLVFDEVSDYSDANFIEPRMKALMRKARAMRISLIAGSQRAPGFNHWLLANCIHRFVFYLTPDDRALLRRSWPTVSAAAEQLHFGVHDFLYQGPDGNLRHYQS